MDPYWHNLTHLDSKYHKFSLQKYFHSQWQLRKLILWKCMYAISVNIVWGHSYENMSQKFENFQLHVLL